MAGRRLTDEEREEMVAPILDNIRQKITSAADGDKDLEFAIRRRVWKQLEYDERGKPQQRRLLKIRKRQEQDNTCGCSPDCHMELPAEGAVLDRLDPAKGYTKENTRLLHPDHDLGIQRARGFS